MKKIVVPDHKMTQDEYLALVDHWYQNYHVEGSTANTIAYQIREYHDMVVDLRKQNTSHKAYISFCEGVIRNHHNSIKEFKSEVKFLKIVVTIMTIMFVFAVYIGVK